MGGTPRDSRPDSTLALLSEGYRFIGNGCARLGTDVFETRLLLQPTLCMQGEEAARLFYDNERFQRRGAAPSRLKKTLFGVGGVQGLDGEAHRARKALFMSLMSPEGLRRMAALAERHWRAAIRRWEGRERLVLLDEVQQLLCRAVHEWAGVPLPEAEVIQRTRELTAMIDGSGAVGPRHWRGLLARKQAERRLGGLVGRVRQGRYDVPEGSALRTVAEHRGPDGKRLSPRVAAVELLNLLRPTVAAARYVVFEALALHEHPQSREQLLEEDDDAAYERFAHEVRRYYPFFPFAAARVRRDFTWKGHAFPRGRRVLLDLYGTNHDPRLWEQPHAFRPERFRTWNGSPFSLIPQGGGDHHTGHRCAGEWLTLELMKVSARMLTRAMRYDVPRQDLSVSLSRIPAEPASRFILANVRALAAEAERTAGGLAGRPAETGLADEHGAPPA